MQLVGVNAELQRVVPHIARQASDPDNLRRKIAFRHITRHRSAENELEVFLAQNVQGIPSRADLQRALLLEADHAPAIYTQESQYPISLLLIFINIDAPFCSCYSLRYQATCKICKIGSLRGCVASAKQRQ